MIFGANTQNKNLASAGKTPKDTSYRTQNANKVSAKVVSDKNVKSKDIDTSREKFQSNGSDKLKGSYEGLMHSASTILQPNNAGYDNKNLQKARYNKNVNFLNNINFSNSVSRVNNNYSIIDNYSKTNMIRNSSSIINSIVKNNMRFS